MSDEGDAPTRRGLAAARVGAVLTAPRFAEAYATTAIAFLLAASTVRTLMGTAGFVTVLAVLTIGGVGILVARRATLTRQDLVAVTLLAFVLWCGISAFWSVRPIVTVEAFAAQLAIAVVGLAIATSRDLVQLIRSVADAARGLLVASLLIEILAGLLLDQPIAVLGIQGGLAAGGPVQGLFGSRNLLGFVCVLGLVAFAVEWRMRSVARWLSVSSVVLGALLLLFSQSPVQAGVLALVCIVGLAVEVVRRQATAVRRGWQIAILGVIVVVAVVGWFARGTILARLNATRELETRLTLWDTIREYAALSSFEGWGWVGTWPERTHPFSTIDFVERDDYRSALSAYVDLYLQVGLVGLLLFGILLGVALVRGWLLATTRRGVAYTWLPMLLVALAATSVMESSALVDGGWLILVLGVLKTRESITRRPPTAPLDGA